MKNEKIAQICCTYFHCVILTKNGNVYSMGSNKQGQLGLGDVEDKSNFCLIDSKYFDHEKIIQVSTGYGHTMMLTQKGNVYICGSDSKEKNIFMDEMNHTFPQKINPSHFDNEPIVYICFAETSESYFVVTKSNKVYACGKNESYQLGIGNIKYQSIPILIDSKTYDQKKIKKILSAQYNTCMLTEDGCVYSCGQNIMGQLGIGISYSQQVNTFKAVSFKQNSLEKNDYDEKIIDIAIGDFHVLALSQSGNVYSWGENESGECGTNDERIKNEPRLINPSYFEHEKITFVSCASLSSFAVTTSGKVYFWGVFQKTFDYVGKIKTHLNWYDEKCVSHPVKMNHKNWIHEKIIELYQHHFCCETHLIVTKSQKLYICNRDENNQLQMNDFFGKFGTNKKIYDNASFEDISIKFEL